MSQLTHYELLESPSSSKSPSKPVAVGGDRQVFAPYDDQTDWKAVSRAALDVVRGANDEAVAVPGQTAA